MHNQKNIYNFAQIFVRTNKFKKKNMKTPFYEIKIKQQERPFSYYAGPTEIKLGPFMMYRKEVIDYCRHLQKCMGRQVKVEFKRIKMTLKCSTDTNK